MRYFIFKTQDEEVAVVDLWKCEGAELQNHQELIKVKTDNGYIDVHIVNDIDRNKEFLRFTTELCKMEDNDPFTMMIEEIRH
jgi:hypothetical protein